MLIGKKKERQVLEIHGRLGGIDQINRIKTVNSKTGCEDFFNETHLTALSLLSRC